MPYCWNCGKEVQAGAKFCPNCAAPQAGHQGPGEGVGAQHGRARLKRAGSWTGLSIANLAGGGALAVLGVILLVVSALGLLFLAVGLVSLAAGFAFWKAKGWGASIGFLSGAGYVLVGFLLFITFSPLYTTLGALGVLLGIVTLFYVRKDSREYLTG